jgi:hypothetical protein
MSGWTVSAGVLDDRALRQLAAMRLLLATDRDRHEADVVLASVFETLADARNRSVDELLSQLESDWPGVVLGRDRLESILEMAEERGLLRCDLTFGSMNQWSMTERAELNVAESRDWASDVLDRCRTQVQDRARALGLDAGIETAVHQTNVLLEVLHDAIVASVTAQPFGIRKVAQRLFPPYDRDVLVACVEKKVDAPETREFLSGLALAALDPGTTFGTEVVHYLATGYVLHALLLGLDVAKSRQEMQAFKGTILLLDTPVLLRLLSGARAFRGTIDMVGRIARAAGCVVVLTSVTRQEFSSMLAYRDGDAGQVEREMADGVSRASLAASANDEVIAAWLSEPSAPSWSAFKSKADEMITTLKAVGVATDFLPDAYVADAILIETLADSVRKVTEDRGRPRGRHPAAHDGQLLAIVDFIRKSKAEIEDAEAIPPGAFIVTSDRALDAAYAAVSRSSGTPVAMTVSQTAAILAQLAQPSDAEELAEVIAADLQWRSRFQHAVSFGVEEAIEMARSFTASADLDTLAFEAATLELTFEAVVRSADHFGDPLSAVRQAVVRQDQRRRAAATAQRNEADAERARDRDRAVRSDVESTTLRGLNVDQSNAINGYRQQIRERDDAAMTDARKRRTRDRRWGVLVGNMVALLAVITLVALSVMTWKATALPVAGLLAMLRGELGWADDPDERMWKPALSVLAWLALGVLGKSVFG